MKKIFPVLLLCLLSFKAFADTVVVAAAANLQFVLEELKTEFTQETGTSVNSVIGSSGKLTTQIENGAPFECAEVGCPHRQWHSQPDRGEVE